MKELSDQRNYYVESLDNMKTQIGGYKNFVAGSLYLQQIPNIDNPPANYAKKEEGKTPSPMKRQRKRADKDSDYDPTNRSRRSSPSKY